jgi:hypothetical protein
VFEEGINAGMLQDQVLEEVADIRYVKIKGHVRRLAASQALAFSSIDQSAISLKINRRLRASSSILLNRTL